MAKCRLFDGAEIYPHFNSGATVMLSSPSNPLPVAPADVKGSVVLVADDEPAWQLLLETELRILGYQPLLAENGREALNRMIEQDPDVAIIDLVLPELDGWHLLSELRLRGMSLPTIFYSAYWMGRGEVEHPDVVACLSKATRTYDVYSLLPNAIRSKKRLKRRPGSAPPSTPPES